MSTRRAAKPATHALIRALTAAAAVLAAAALAACQSTSSLLLENRLDRNIKVDAVVPVFGPGVKLGGAVIHIGNYQRSALVGDRSLWDAAERTDDDHYVELGNTGADVAPYDVVLSIRDASLVSPRFTPLSVRTHAEPRTGYLAVAEAIDGNVYLILADDKGTRLDQASTPLFQPK